MPIWFLLWRRNNYKYLKISNIKHSYQSLKSIKYIHYQILFLHREDPKNWSLYSPNKGHPKILCLELNKYLLLSHFLFVTQRCHKVPKAMKFGLERKTSIRVWNSQKFWIVKGSEVKIMSWELTRIRGVLGLIGDYL